ncbi:MAG: zf-HC2 domain-containing protein [Calditrichaceae bacterium]|nr:zf-HC2 domain-containing protein [Calditrichaceae bacterium]MBN2707639.1 zf-HC2 domain-containing protein [Calditrichaceae bacterium]RQV93191.1 MAG: zf-HC2 domain-containing protein [Calditrichota bacterium]
MKNGHLTARIINEYIDGLYDAGRNKEIDEHLKDCSRCKQAFDEYRFVIKEIEKTGIYEPDDNFENLVTQNLPDIYPKKHAAFYEIISVIMISALFLSAIGYFIFTGAFNPLPGIIDTGAVILDNITDYLKNLEFLYDNARILSLLIFYIVAFIIFNRFVTKSRLIDFKKRILKYLFLVNRFLFSA